MTEQLRREILEIIQDMSNRFEDLSHTEIVQQAEELLDRALLAEFLASRKLRKTALEKRLNDAVGTIQKEAITSPEAAKKQETPAKPVKKVEEVEQIPYPMNPEIKVVPHPEGPPAMRHDEEPKPLAVEQPKAAVKTEPVVAEQKKSIAEKAQQGQKTKSLHERLAAKHLSFGLNDRIAYVKHLFDGSTEDFNRVISQLNTLSTWDEVAAFISEIVKPDYNWDGKEEYEERFVAQVKTKFEQL